LLQKEGFMCKPISEPESQIDIKIDGGVKTVTKNINLEKVDATPREDVTLFGSNPDQTSYLRDNRYLEMSQTNNTKFAQMAHQGN
jgi:hypothetical protein